MISRERLAELRRQIAHCSLVNVTVPTADLRQLLAAAEDAKRIRELAERAVVALHIQNHAGINAPPFPECRKFLCGDWHALTDTAGGGE